MPSLIQAGENRKKKKHQTCIICCLHSCLVFKIPASNFQWLTGDCHMGKGNAVTKSKLANLTLPCLPLPYSSMHTHLGCPPVCLTSVSVLIVQTSIIMTPPRLTHPNLLSRPSLASHQIALPVFSHWLCVSRGYLIDVPTGISSLALPLVDVPFQQTH